MASFAAQQVARLETILAQNVGVASISVDGVNVSYNDLYEQYLLWKSRCARENGQRPRAAQIYLGAQR